MYVMNTELLHSIIVYRRLLEKFFYIYICITYIKMRLSFLGNQIDVHTLQSHSITILLLHVLIKCTWVLHFIQSWTLVFILNKKIRKCNKIVGLIRRLAVCLPRKAQSKIEKVQYKACIPITGGIQETSRERLYDELGLMSLSKRRWYNKLIFFYKIGNRILPDYLHFCIELLSQNKYPLRSVSPGKLKCTPSRTKSFSKTFFP